MLPPRQFKIRELVCLGLTGMFLLTAVLAAQTGARDMAMRIRCRDNLRQIGQAIATYSNNETRNGNAFPRVKFSIPDLDHPTFFAAWKQPHSFGEGAPVNDVTAAFYLLFKTQDLAPGILVCPESGKKPLTFGHQNPAPAHPIAATKGALSNFPGMDYVSYSIENMYPSRDALSGGWRWNAAIWPDYALMADLNPGGRSVSAVKPNSPAKDMAGANSPNHARAGQNVLYGDLHVEFSTTPFCGSKLDDGTMDNIYCRRATAAGDSVVGPPMDRFDSVLLPTADYKAGK